MATFTIQTAELNNYDRDYMAYKPKNMCNPASSSSKKFILKVYSGKNLGSWVPKMSAFGV